MPGHNPGIRYADPLPRSIRSGPYALDPITGHRTADRGTVYSRGGYGPTLEAVCAGCMEAICNGGDHRGGWSDRPLYPGEDVGCWVCGRAIS